MDDLLSGSCPCCIPSSCVALLVAAWVGVLGYRAIARPSRGVSCCVWTLTILVALVAIGLGVLANHKPLRESLFSKMCLKLSKDPKMKPLRCGVVGNATGNVLEFGPGPGTNFQCWESGRIEKWVGVEPNKNFDDMVASEADARGLTFPRDFRWFKGEDVDVHEGTFDTAIATHVLFSVDSVDQVLKQAHRALKVGGRLLVMEHVVSPTGSLMWYAQSAVGPAMKIIGNGCEFKDTWRNLDKLVASGQFEGSYQHVQAPVPVPFLKPHIVGELIKVA